MLKKYLDNFLINFTIVIVLCSVIIFPQLKLIGLYFTGLDYLFYLVFLITFLLKGKINYEKKVMTLLCLILVIGLFSLIRSNYIKNYFLSILGFLIILLPFITYILFYNINITKENLLKVFKQIQIILLVVSLSALVNFALGRINEYGSPYTITKDIGFAATLCNINIIISLTLYNYKKSKKHIYIIVMSFLAILIISALKSLIMSLAIMLYYLYSKDLNKYIKQATYIFAISFFSLIIFSNDFIQKKIETYVFLYVTSDNSLEIARTASYFASVNIATDHFPLGSGPGTFGSYPVLITYNDLYYDYNLSHVWGMSEENIKDPDLPTFILDTYWPSPLAEIGVIGVLLLLMLYFHPLIKIKRLIKSSNAKDLELFKSLKFFIFSTALVLFVENFSLSSLSQTSVIILYFGLSGLIINFKEKQNENITYK